MNGPQSWQGTLAHWSIRILACLGFLLTVVSITPVDRWWARLLEGHAYDQRGDVLVVLSGSELDDGSMGWSSYLRARYATESFRSGGFKEMVISGGPSGGSSVPISVAMGNFIECEGIPRNAIHLETSSESTRENGLYSRAILNTLPGRKVLLTSDYHMFRARRVFAKLGVQLFAQPVPDAIKRSGRWWGRWPAFLDLLVETCKIGYYWLRGWI